MRWARRRLRPYLATASMGATGGIGEHPLVLLDHGIALLRVALVVVIWRAILSGHAHTEAGSKEAVLTYVLLARVLGEQLDVRSGVLTAIWEGTIASRLLRPMSVFGDYLAEMAGGWVLRWVTFSVPALLLAPVLGVRIAPAAPALPRLVAFAASLIASIAVGAAVDFLFALVVIRTSENMWSLLMARNALTPVVSGAVIPLPLLPWGIGDVLSWSPFASMVAAPLRIYTGDGDVLHLLGLQVAWAAALWAVTRYAWRHSAPKMVSFGG